MSKLKNIHEALRHYKPGQRKSLADMYFAPDDRMLTWEINHICNYTCDYCNRFHKDHPDVYKYSPEYIQKCFDSTNKTWHIIISGGEPFLHKHIIEICSRLTQKHFISVNSNISLPVVKDFADTIKPERVILFNASIHFAEREKRNTLDDYISQFIYLQDKGFDIVGSYVVHPLVLHRYKEDIAFLKSKGLRRISAKLFEGVSGGKRYPVAYSKNEIEGIKSFMTSEIEMPEYLVFNKFKGLRCQSGKKMLTMLPNGDLVRCISDPTPMGNFFDKTYKEPVFSKKCVTEICQCPYQGMLYSKKTIL